MKRLTLSVFLLVASYSAALHAQAGCTTGTLTDPSVLPENSPWSNLPDAIAFIGTEGTSLGDVQTAMGPWDNACSPGLPQIYYGGSPADYAFSGTELWTVHKGRAAEIGMVGSGCAEADFTAKKIRLTTVGGH